jgi:hypothetical protein
MAKKVPNPIDKHVGSQVRMRPMMLGMSQGRLGVGLRGNDCDDSHFVGVLR